MKIGILQTGRSPETLQKNFGDYNDLFMKLFKQQDFEFITYAVIDSIFPQTPTETDAWLITGSRHGAYEKLAWIPPLENFIRSAYKAKVPIVAICFGHQILAQALGGKVEKFKGGMKCGVEKLNLKGSSEENYILAWYGDQVIQTPPDAEVIGSTDFCKNAALAYGDRAISFQHHPEFDLGFAKKLFQVRKKTLSPEVIEETKKNLTKKVSHQVTQKIVEFLQKKRQNFNQSKNIISKCLRKKTS